MTGNYEGAAALIAHLGADFGCSGLCAIVLDPLSLQAWVFCPSKSLRPSFSTLDLKA